MNRRVILIVGGIIGLCIFFCFIFFAYLLWYSSKPEFVAELAADSATFAANRLTSDAQEETLTSQSATLILPSDTPSPSETPLPTSTPEPSETPFPTSTPADTSVPSATSTVGPTETPSRTSTPSTTVTASPTLTPSPTYTPSPTTDPIESFEGAAKEILGSSNRDVKKLDFVELFDDELFVQWAINDNLVESWIRAGAEENAKDILRALSDTNLDYSAITLIGTFALIDGFGNVSEDMVLSASYFQDTVERINWDNYYLIKIFDIADETWFHPAFPD